MYKNESQRLVEATALDQKIWIDLYAPTKEEVDNVVEMTGVQRDFLTSVLDAEESSRIDIEDDQMLIVINVAVRQDETTTQFRTIPLGIVILRDYIITVSLEELDCLNKFRLLGNRIVNVEKQAKFTLQMIYQVTALYLRHLNSLNAKTDQIEDALYDNMEDELFIDLLKIEKTLVYFRNSLSSNKSVVDKLFRSSYLTLYEQDENLLDDINIELIQAMEMSETSAAIIRSIRDGIASLMSNKLNVTMQALAAITIIMTIPTMVFSFYGMNVNLGDTGFEYYAVAIIAVTSVITLIVYFIMRNRKFF
ncbi:magnesium transporter CorA family protein [Mollicutes bacterium LVI A0078]|nr:magnesium transporter CorA family protein [Mollicutes bacterium LVI A0075]WOO91023.1 magnesium transporter CorA family protein [Mollicutes bacterium LVI A0078]